MPTQISAIVSESTCDNPDCTFSGPEFYVRDGQHLCGRCLDRLDDEAMPYLVSDYAWSVLREVEARS